MTMTTTPTGNPKLHSRSPISQSHGQVNAMPLIPSQVNPMEEQPAVIVADAVDVVKDTQATMKVCNYLIAV